MTSLRYKDKNLLEQAFEMSFGDVLDFNDKKFKDFIESVLLFNVHEKYTGSNANKMREIWKNESNMNVAKLLEEIADMYFKDSLEGQVILGFDEVKVLENKRKHYRGIIDIINYLRNNVAIVNSHKNIDNYEHLTEFVKQAWDDLSGEKYWDVITKARTILEITFKEVCKRRSIVFDDKNINKTFTNIRMHFDMDAKDSKCPDYVKSLISNTANLVNKIAEARNKNSSSHAPERKIEKHYAQLCLEQAISLMNFIISLDELNPLSSKH